MATTAASNEPVLCGVPEIAAYLEMLWRRRLRKRGRRVHESAVRRWLRRPHQPLPAYRHESGMWIAVREEVEAWWRDGLTATAIGGNGGNGGNGG